MRAMPRTFPRAHFVTAARAGWGIELPERDQRLARARLAVGAAVAWDPSVCLDSSCSLPVFILYLSCISRPFSRPTQPSPGWTHGGSNSMRRFPDEAFGEVYDNSFDPDGCAANARALLLDDAHVVNGFEVVEALQPQTVRQARLNSRTSPDRCWPGRSRSAPGTRQSQACLPHRTSCWPGSYTAQRCTWR